MSNYSFAESARSFLAIVLGLLGSAIPGAAWDPNAPVYPVAYNDGQKADQLKAGEDLLEKLHSAVKNGDTSFTISPGVYRFSGTNSAWVLGSQRYSQPFTITAKDVELILDGNSYQGLWNPQDSSNLALIGPLTVDMDPIPESQAQVLSYDPASQTLTVQFMAGYPDPPLTGNFQNPALMSYDKDGVWRGNYSGYYSTLTWQTHDSAKRIGVLAGVKDDPKYYQPGDYVAIAWNGNWAMIDGENVTNFTVQDLTVYGGCVGVTGHGDYHGWVNFTGLKAVRRPGTNRLLGGSGFEATATGLDTVVTFDGCEFGSSWDDMMDFKSTSIDAMDSQLSARELLVFDTPAGQGDTVRFFDPVTFATRAIAKVISVTNESSTDDERAQHKALINKVSGFPNSNPTQAQKMVLDQDVTLHDGDLYSTISQRGTFIMRNCYLHDANTRVMLHGFARGLIENNVFERIHEGVQLNSDIPSLNGTLWDNLTVRNNTFVSTPYQGGAPALAVGPNIYPSGNFAADVQSNVTIVGNTITNPNGTGIELFGCSPFLIGNNVISGISPAGASAIHLYADANGSVENNKVLNSGTLGLLVDGANSQNIQITKNVFDNTGSMAEHESPGHVVNIGTVIQLNGGGNFSLSQNYIENPRSDLASILQINSAIQGVTGQTDGVILAPPPERGEPLK